jgi:hypothetical protein
MLCQVARPLVTEAGLSSRPIGSAARWQPLGWNCLAAHSYKGGAGLIDLDLRALPMDEITSKHRTAANHKGDKHRAERQDLFCGYRALLSR